VAIGGITADNAAGLATAGADFLAVSAGVWNYPRGPAAGVAAINAAIAAGLAAKLRPNNAVRGTCR
jgi:thiamine-phosphate pyrophosphorylase